MYHKNIIDQTDSLLRYYRSFTGGFTLRRDMQIVRRMLKSTGFPVIKKTLRIKRTK